MGGCNPPPKTQGTQSTSTKCWPRAAWNSLLHLCAAVTVCGRPQMVVRAHPSASLVHPFLFLWSATQLSAGANFAETA